VLAPHKTVHIVEIAQTMYIIGVADNMTVLDKMTDEQTYALMRMTVADRPQVPSLTLKRSIVAHSPERIRAIVEQKLRRAVSRS
jgi:hypothetical protein